MAFSAYRFTRVSLADNTGALTGVLNPSSTSVVFNGPAVFTYASATDAIATISAANYFASQVYSLAVGDIIIAVGSDASDMLQVAALDKDAGTVSVQSFTPAGTVGTSNITNLAVTTAKINDLAVTTGKLADAAVTSAKLDATTVQYAEVDMTAAQWNGMYAAPYLLVAAPGANKIIVVDKVVLNMTFVSAEYADGGVVNAQYDSTVHGAGSPATATVAAATINGYAASTGNLLTGALSSVAFTAMANKGLYLSNATAAFTTGDSTWKVQVWYKVVSLV